jgi:hypothetical protein
MKIEMKNINGVGSSSNESIEDLVNVVSEKASENSQDNASESSYQRKDSTMG